MSFFSYKSKIVQFKSLQHMLEAMKRGEVPVGVVSPGGAAGVLGITRQAVHERIKRGTLRAWGYEGYIFVDARDVRALAKRKRGIAATQGELLDESP